jgi:uncharacterized protein (DUF2267 family)
VNDKEFYRSVAQRAGLSREEAADLTRATLETLADRVSGGEARDLAAELPEPLAQPLRSGDEAAKRFDLEEFVRRVSERTALTAAETTSGIRAVLVTLREVASSHEFTEVMAQLSKDFRTLIGMPVAVSRG